MIQTVTSTYDSADKVKNARRDLEGKGIPQEKIHVDKDTNQIKVAIPAATKPEVLEILNRHKPISIY